MEQLQNGAEEKIAFESLGQTFQSTINLNGKFGDFVAKGKLNFTYEKFGSDQFSVTGVNFLLSGITSLQDLVGKITPTSLIINTVAKNYSGIADLDYKGKYIASMLYRIDGSSLFGPNNRWNPYYRISGAYRIGEDLKIPGIQELKLRAAVGTSGQRPEFNYQYETFTMENGVPIGYTLGNKNLKPSETKETELGVNCEFLNKFELEIIQSFNETNGDFMNVPLSAVTGFRYQWRNATIIKGTSFETTLGAQIIKSKDLDWRFNLTFDKMSQKISALENTSAFSTGPKSAFRVQAGEPYGIMYGYAWVKTIQQMEQQLPEGKTIDDYTVNSEGYVIPKGTEGTPYEIPIPYDKNKDGQPYEIADMNPRFNMSFSTNLEWKNILFSMLWNWKCGGNIYNETKQMLFRDQRAGVNDQYGKPEYQKKTTDYYNTFYYQDITNSYFVEDASYLKLREMSIYYSFSSKFFSKVGISFIKNAKLGILGRNLLTFTKYTGWDPEVCRY